MATHSKVHSNYIITMAYKTLCCPFISAKTVLHRPKALEFFPQLEHRVQCLRAGPLGIAQDLWACLCSYVSS